MVLEFYSRVAEGYQLKSSKTWKLILKFGEVTGGKLIGGTFNAHHLKSG